MKFSSTARVSVKKILALSTLFAVTVLTLSALPANAWRNEPAPKPLPESDEAIDRFRETFLKLQPIDYTRISDPNYTSVLLQQVCPGVFSETDLKYFSVSNFAFYGLKLYLPLPHNIRQDLPQSRRVKAVISGAGPIMPWRHKKVCLNHLAFVIARRIPYYRFFTPYEFKVMNNVYNHATKIPALISTLKHLKPDDWVLWIDDDVITSDFMQHPMDESHSYLDDPIEKLVEPLPLTDRVIRRARALYEEEKKERKAKEEEEKSKDPNKEADKTQKPLLAPSMIAIIDSKDTVLNTGVLLVKNDRNAQKLLDLWWYNVLSEQFPVQTEFFCHRTKQAYVNLKDCLTACVLSMQRDAMNCGPDKDLSKAMADWNKDKVKLNYLFDQDVMKRLYRWEHKDDNPRPDYISSIRLVKARQDFYLKNSKEEPVEEAFNAFFRDFKFEGQVSARDPLLDKWVHVSGMSDEDKNAYIRMWLTGVVNYPVRQRPDGTEPLLEWIPVELLNDCHGEFPPKQTDATESASTDPIAQQPKPVIEKVISERCLGTSSDLNLLLYGTGMLTSLGLGIIGTLLFQKYKPRKFF